MERCNLWPIQSRSPMPKLIKFITLILNFVFINDALAFDGYCENCKKEKGKIIIDTVKSNFLIKSIPCTKESNYLDTNNKQTTISKPCKSGDKNASLDTIVSVFHMVKIKFETDSTRETTITLSDSAGNIMKSIHSIWKDNNLVRAIYDNDTLDIIDSHNPCIFTIIEYPSDSTIIHLDPEKEDLYFKNNVSTLTSSNISLKHKLYIDTSFIYADILLDKHFACKRYHNKE